MMISQAPGAPPGLAARRAAADLLEGVLHRNRPFDEHFDGGHAQASLRTLSERDRALTRRIVATSLRKLGTLRKLIGDCLNQGLREKVTAVFGLESALITGAAQLLFLGIPDHAAVDLSVRLVQGDRSSARFAGVVNAVLRQIARNGTERLAQLEPMCLDTPPWLLARWVKTYGEDIARAIAEANGREPPLDLTVKSDPDRWAEQLQGRTLPTGSVRLAAHGPISALPGYTDGSWSIQDAAAALPVRLFGDVRGRSVADLCAAPGGKTSQLALAGAHVTAIDRSEPRMARLRENLARTGLAAATVVASAEQWTPEPAANSFDAILVDAPCTATGTNTEASGYSMAQGTRRHRGTGRRPGTAARARHRSDQAWRHHRVLHMLIGTRGGRTCRGSGDGAGHSDSSPADRSGGAVRPRRVRHPGGGPAHLAVPVAGFRSPDGGLDGFFAARLDRL